MALACLLCVLPHHAQAQDGQRRTNPPDVVETVVPALGLIGLVAMAYRKAYQALTGSAPAAKLSRAQHPSTSQVAAHTGAHFAL